MSGVPNQITRVNELLTELTGQPVDENDNLASKMQSIADAKGLRYLTKLIDKISGRPSPCVLIEVDEQVLSHSICKGNSKFVATILIFVFVISSKFELRNE